MAENRPHYRHELKFLINAGDRELLARRLDVLMRRDPHAPEGGDRKSTRLNSSHSGQSRMPSSA